jgi:flagellar motor switch protein FliN
VSETIEYEQFDERGAAGAAAPADADLRRLSDIPMELSVEIGRTQTTVGDTLDLRVGSLIELEREAGAPADLLVNGTPIARGEVVVIDARYGLRITEILDAADQIEQTGGPAGSDPALGDAGEADPVPAAAQADAAPAGDDHAQEAPAAQEAPNDAGSET